MDLPKISIKRPVAMMMVMFIIIILGVVSISRMQMSLTPDMEFPVALIMTEYTGAGPEEVESLVTEVIESSVANVEGIDSIISQSSDGTSIVVTQFDYGTDMDVAVMNIRDRIGMYESMLPDAASSPTIMKMDMNAMPVAFIIVSSDTMHTSELKNFVDDNIKPRMERQTGVASVDVMGGQENEIRVEVDPERLEGLGIDIQTIGSVLAAENTNQSGGTVEYGDKSLSISTKLKMESEDEIRKTPIRLPSGTVMALEDISRITVEEKEITSISRFNGEECVMLSITKSSDGNTVEAVKAVKKEIESVNRDYTNITAEVIQESATQIEDSINNVIKNIFTGAVLAILTLFIFLKNVGLAGVTAVSIPVSIIGTFVLLYFSGTTLNMVSLGGLSIGVGMLVDNSVVVLENIYRYRTKEGYEKVKGTYRATKEVQSAIVASTLTTIVVFVPFIFTSGMVMELMGDLAISVVFSLVMSLAVAITIVPMLAGNYVNNVRRNKAPRPLGFINKIISGFDIFIKGTTKVYGKALEWAVMHKKRTMLVVLVVFIGSICLMPMVGMELMPASDEGRFSITVEAPKGAKLEVMDLYAQKVEAILDIPEMKNYTVSMSGGGGMSAMMGGSNLASFSCELIDKNEREKSTADIVEEIRNQTKAIAGVNVTVAESSNMSGMSGGITVEIYGDELDVLESISDELIRQIENVEGTRQVTSSMDEQDKQVAITLDKEKIRQYGLTGTQVASQIRNIISGYTATTLKADGTEYDIRIVYPEESVTNVTNLGDIAINANGAYLPLASIASIDLDGVPSAIARENQTRYVSVTADLYGRDMGSVGRDVQSIIDQMSFPDGYTVSLGGSNEMMVETFTSLGLVIVLAIVLVYMVMAAQFESFLNPFIIMFTLPLALTGAIVLLFITGESLSMMGLIGALVLVGIVVNNGIVLIDYIDTLRDRDKMELIPAVLKGCPTRLRPILMTALTTIFGQFPVIFSTGSNSEMLRGMGLVIVGGLTTSTFLTLFVVPIMYVLFDRLATKVRKKLHIKPKAMRSEIDEQCA